MKKIFYFSLDNLVEVTGEDPEKAKDEAWKIFTEILLTGKHEVVLVDVEEIEE